jgi:hypothetical protein
LKPVVPRIYRLDFQFLGPFGLLTQQTLVAKIALALQFFDKYDSIGQNNNPGAKSVEVLVWLRKDSKCEKF